MTFTDDARETMEDLLKALPFPVRDDVLRCAEARAETLAGEADAGEIPAEIAVRSFIECTPSDLRERLKPALSYRGLDPDDFRAAFES